MKAADLPARFTIENAHDPLGSARYLAVTDEGRLAWCEPFGRINVFDCEKRATDFRDFRLPFHAADAVVVRHTVH